MCLEMLVRAMFMYANMGSCGLQSSPSELVDTLCASALAGFIVNLVRRVSASSARLGEDRANDSFTYLLRLYPNELPISVSVLASFSSESLFTFPALKSGPWVSELRSSICATRYPDLVDCGIIYAGLYDGWGKMIPSTPHRVNKSVQGFDVLFVRWSWWTLIIRVLEVGNEIWRALLKLLADASTERGTMRHRSYIKRVVAVEVGYGFRGMDDALSFDHLYIWALWTSLELLHPRFLSSPDRIYYADIERSASEILVWELSYTDMTSVIFENL
ncbi:hypothetical protein BDN70DRAFT_901598 [Pholiota conissans]|uniref:Uncharacterized protein n=1 Tax=Pholiota conissans TaxID=109636 RepID=A0A9P6CSJ7_9AGAR|nr:hypothetical protein BDN70DRAFT_901598 [Pholiota conissans]